MAQKNSFDVVSKVDLAEVKNAVNQTNKELSQRYDLKSTGSTVELDEKAPRLVLSAPDEFTLKAVDDVLKQKLVRRGVSLKALFYGAPEPAAKSTLRQHADLQQGIPMEKAKEIVKLVKQSKLKVQAAIMDDMVRVSGRDRDTLQEVIAMLKEEDFGIDMQFTNYRSQ